MFEKTPFEKDQLLRAQMRLREAEKKVEELERVMHSASPLLQDAREKRAEAEWFLAGVIRDQKR